MRRLSVARADSRGCQSSMSESGTTESGKSALGCCPVLNVSFPLMFSRWGVASSASWTEAQVYLKPWGAARSAAASTTRPEGAPGTSSPPPRRSSAGGPGSA
jgi:hypothetical protein